MEIWRASEIFLDARRGKTRRRDERWMSGCQKVKGSLRMEMIRHEETRMEDDRGNKKKFDSSFVRNSEF